MPITVQNANQITMTGGSAGTPLLIQHLTTLANWPAGTLQATVNSYITKVAGSYTFIIPAAKKICVAGHLNLNDATIRSLGLGGHLHALSGGFITGGRFINGKVFNRTTWIFDLGAKSNANATVSDINNSFLSGTGQINMVGLRILNNAQSPGAIGNHTGIGFNAGVGGSFNLQALEVLTEGNVPTYLNFNAANAGSVAELKEARVGAIRHLTTNVQLSFGDGGWIGGDNGSRKPKLLVPATQTTYVGFAPIIQQAGDIINVTNLNFGPPDVIFRDQFVPVAAIAMFQGQNSIARIQRTITHNILTPVGVALNNVTCRAISGATSLINSVRNNGSSNVVTVWTGSGALAGSGDGVYLLPSTVIDNRAIALLYRRADLTQATADLTGEFGAAPVSVAMPVDSNFTGTVANAEAITGIAFTIVSGAANVLVTSPVTPQAIYNYWKAWTSQPAQTNISQSLITNSGSLIVSGVVTMSGAGSITGAFVDANQVGFITAEGSSGNTVELRRVSNNTVIRSRIGDGLITVAPADVGVATYLARLSGGVLVASSITAPVTLIAGNNGIVQLYFGSQVQLANVDRVNDLPTLAQMEASTIIAKEATVASRASQTSVNAIPTNPLLTTDARLNNLNATISSRSTLTGPQVRTELSTELGRIDTTISSRLASSSYTAPTTPPTAVQIRQEIDTNSTKLDVAIGTRLATASYTAPANANITAIKTKTDTLVNAPTLGQIEASTVLAKQSGFTGLATGANVTTAQTAIVAEVNANETKIDAVKAETALIKTKTDSLNNAPTAVQIRTELEVVGGSINDIKKSVNLAVALSA